MLIIGTAQLCGHEFKANADAAACHLRDLAECRPFTNYAADFGAADNNAGTIFRANTDVTDDTGPGVVRSYTDFTRHFTNADSGRNGAVNIRMPREQFSLPIATVPLSMELAE